MEHKTKYNLDEVLSIIEKKTGSQIGGLEDKEYTQCDVDEIVAAILETKLLEEKEKNE